MNMKTVFLLPVMILFVNNSCYALDWLLDPGFSFTERYTDNYRLQITPQPATLLSTISPSLLLGYVADDNELKTQLNWNELLYLNQANLNFAEKIINVDHAFHAERWNTKLIAKYGEEAAIASQLDVNGSGQIVGVQVPRYTRSLIPEFNYQLTERNSLQLSGGYTDVTFGSHPSVGYTDYTNQLVSAMLTHLYSEKLSFDFSTGYTIYSAGNNNLPNTIAGTTYTISGLQVPQTFVNLFTPIPASSLSYNYALKSTYINYQLGFRYTYDEKTLFTGSAGIRDVTSHSQYSYNQNPNCVNGPLPVLPFITQSCNIPNNQSITFNTLGNIYSLGVKRDFEQGNLNLSANQQISPASTGTLQQTTVINAIGQYQLSDRWSAGLTGMYLKSVSTAGTASGTISSTYLNRVFISASPNIQWKWTPDINLQLSYTYMNQVYTVTDQTAVSNGVQLQFVYQPPINRQVK